MDGLTDHELMAMVRGGSFSAFDALYERYRHRVYRFLFSLTWNYDEAADGMQETFVRLYQARARYEPTTQFSTYLFQIAANYYRWQRRKRGVRREAPLGENVTGLLAGAATEPETHLLAAYERWRVRQAIASLGEGRRLVFVMAQLEGMRYAEISEVLGVPVGTVKSRMSAAVRELREILAQEASGRAAVSLSCNATSEKRR